MVRGFTLIELVVVLVIFAILAAMGSGYVLTTVEAYHLAAERNKMVNRSRALVERMSRQLRLALPHSVRVSASGNCVEFMQITGGGSYEGQLPDANNGMPATATITTVAFFLQLGSAKHAAVGAMDASEIYASGSDISRAAIASVNGPPVTLITLAASHRFIRNSINERVYVLDDPERFCLVGTEFHHYSNYGISGAALTDADPGGQDSLMGQDLVSNGAAFSLSPATQSRNTLVAIAFGIQRNDETMNINHQVQIKNVP